MSMCFKTFNLIPYMPCSIDISKMAIVGSLYGDHLGNDLTKKGDQQKCDVV